MSDIANFQIVPVGQGYRIEPLSDIACSLVVHCRKHGDELMYPTQAGAEEAVMRMETAIANRGGRPWVVFAG